jgi:hypothetical protein
MDFQVILAGVIQKPFGAGWARLARLADSRTCGPIKRKESTEYVILTRRESNPLVAWLGGLEHYFPNLALTGLGSVACKRVREGAEGAGARTLGAARAGGPARAPAKCVTRQVLVGQRGQAKVAVARCCQADGRTRVVWAFVLPAAVSVPCPSSSTPSPRNWATPAGTSSCLFTSFVGPLAF